ncbi:MAG: GT4 family glycosyltransferase PelF [Kineosporiaceae bacterium]
MIRPVTPRHARRPALALEQDEQPDVELGAPLTIAYGGNDAGDDADDMTVEQPLWSVLTSMAPASRASARLLHIALVGEGAYPFGPGGVSLWCHQLIQGMPEHSFTSVALTVDGTERRAWDPPENLTNVINIPLWGMVSRAPRPGAPSPAFVEAHRAFLHALLRPVEEIATGQVLAEFDDALRAMIESARDGDVSRELATDQSVQRLVEAWRVAQPDGYAKQLSLRDAIGATSRFEHLLRPLAHPPVAADVCHLSMGGVSALVALRSKWALGTPIVLSEHGVYLRERYLALAADPATYPVKMLTTRFHRALTGVTYRMADVLAPHSSFNRRWQRYGGGEGDRTETMYNGIDPADFPLAQGEPDEPTLVFVGRIDRLKDVHTLIRAFAVVRESLPEARLRIFGPVSRENEEYYRSCLALRDELGVADAATFEGRVAHTAEAYCSGHVVLLTSVSEGFPFTIVEAMSVGRPTVATDVGGVSEAVGDTGFIVPPRDYHAVADACLTLLRDADLRREMGERARRRVLDQFTLRQWTDAYRDVYTALTPSAHPRHAARPSQVVDDLSEASGSIVGGAVRTEESA